MAVFKEQWATSYSAAAINASASAFFGNAETDAIKRQKYGSANSLIVTNNSTENILIYLDGLSSRVVAISYANGGTVVLRPEDGIYFDFIKLENISATNTSDNEIKIRIARATPMFVMAT